MSMNKLLFHYRMNEMVETYSLQPVHF